MKNFLLGLCAGLGLVCMGALTMAAVRYHAAANAEQEARIAAAEAAAAGVPAR